MFFNEGRDRMDDVLNILLFQARVEGQGEDVFGNIARGGQGLIRSRENSGIVRMMVDRGKVDARADVHFPQLGDKIVAADFELAFIENDHIEVSGIDMVIGSGFLQADFGDVRQRFVVNFGLAGVS